MTLDKQRVIDELIKYDSEHPATLGEMADRRVVYAQRFVDMANESLIPKKHRIDIGDGVSTDYVFPNPFHSTDVIAQIIRTEDGYLYDQIPEVSRHEIRVHFDHRMKPGEASLIVHG